jgi:hypothetical protein
MRIRMFLSVCIFLVVPAFAVAWEGKADNKPVDELMLMDDMALTMEALQPCSKSTSGRQTAKASSNSASFNHESLKIKSIAMSYVQTIERIAQQKHGGTTPDWATTMTQAVSTDNSSMCLRAMSEMFAAQNQKRPRK